MHSNAPRPWGNGLNVMPLERTAFMGRDLNVMPHTPWYRMQLVHDSPIYQVRYSLHTRTVIPL